MCVSEEEDDTVPEKTVLDDGDQQLWAPRDDSSDIGEQKAACAYAAVHRLNSVGARKP